MTNATDTTNATIAEDLFFCLDSLVDALKSDGVMREAYYAELLQAEAMLNRAMSVMSAGANNGDANV